MYKAKANQKLVKHQKAQIIFDEQNALITLDGTWLWSTINERTLTQQIASIIQTPLTSVTVNGKAIQQIDTAGVYFIINLINGLKHNAVKLSNLALPPLAEQLLTTIKQTMADAIQPNSEVTRESLFSALGRHVLEAYQATVELLGFFGHFWLSVIHAIISPISFNYTETMRTIYEAGLKGLWVSVLLSFLIGVTLAYQISPQFVTYGANVYIVNFLGISLLKEVSPLLTAIIVAGRTGAAITAEIGTQKIQEEIDALQTMGISPMQRIVLPKVLGVMIAVPLITAIADVASMLGGAVVANSSLDVTYIMFMQRLQNQVSVNNYSCGIIKSVMFAYLIALVGCFCGFKVTNNANSVGTQTTKSVVLGIILIVFVDAIFAIIFKILGV